MFAKTLLFAFALWYNFYMDDKTQKIISLLSAQFPDAKSELTFTSTYQLLVSVILSAQCTDKRVNQVTPALFAVAPTPQQMCELPTEEIEKLIHSCGFYHSKAKYIKNMSRDLVSRFDGKVPSDFNSLCTLSGVGRKTANVVYAVGFGGQAIAVDTHVFRVSNRTGLAKAANVEQTEQQLKERIDNTLWSECHHYLLLHGRYVCKSRNPQCSHCAISSYCDYFAKQNPSKQ